MILQQVQKEVRDGLKTYKVFQELDKILDDLIASESALFQKKKIISLLEKRIEERNDTIKDLDNEIKGKEQRADEIIKEAEEGAAIVLQDANLEIKEDLKKLKQQLSNTESKLKEKQKTLSGLNKSIEDSQKAEISVTKKLDDAKAELRKLLGGE